MNASHAIKNIGRPLSGVTAAMLVTGAALGAVICQSWLAAVGLLAAVFLAALAACSPMLIWVLWLAGMLFGLHYIQPPLSTAVFWGLAVLFIGAVGFRLFIRREQVVFGDPFFWMALGAWLVWGLVSALVNGDIVASAREVMRYAIMTGILASYVQWFSKGQTVFRALRCVWIGLCFYAVILTARSFLEGQWAGQLLGSHWHSDAESAGFFVTFVPLFMSVRRHMRGRRWDKFVWFAVFLALIVLSSSSTAVMAVFVGIMTLYTLTDFKGGGKLIVFGALAVFGIMAVTALTVRGAGDWMIYQFSGREKIWPAALHAITTHPFFGVGPGQWLQWFGTHYIRADFILPDLKGNIVTLDPRTLHGAAHDLYLTKGAEMGIPSVILLLTSFGIWIKHALSVYIRLPKGVSRDLVRGCLASFAGLVTYSIFENGPIFGTAREGEVLLVMLVMAIPLSIPYRYRPVEEVLS